MLVSADSSYNTDWNACADCAGTVGGDAVEDCAGVCAGYAMEDSCGVCHEAYCYDYVTHQTNTDFPCDGPTEMLVSADSSYNTDWNASCNIDPEYSIFTWDYFIDNSGGSNYPTSCDSENCELVELVTLTGGMITSSGNLYGVSSPLFININSGYSFIESIDLTISTLGTELDYASTLLNVNNQQFTPNYEILSHSADDWGGASVTVKYSWSDLSNVSFNQGWTIEFAASGAHMSLDQVILEWNSLNEDCCGVADGNNSNCENSGDVNNDGSTNVNDIVYIVDSIIGGSELSECEIIYSDLNNDGSINVIDVVGIVELILGNGLARNNISIPKNVELIHDSNALFYKSDVKGLIGFEIMLSHEKYCDFELTDLAFIADYNTNGNITKMIIVIENGNYLFSSTKSFEIINIITSSSLEEIDHTISKRSFNDKLVIDKEFGFKSAYPNPFNPITSLEFNMIADGYAKIDIFNMAGQLVSTLYEGYLSSDIYSFTWKAYSYPSGMYIAKAISENNVSMQKIMLMK